MPIVKTGVLKLKYNKGFSMIEILVALVILAIGLLGMATLMMNSLQTNQSAAMRSAATQAAYDLIERMRSNTDEKVLKNKKYEITRQAAITLGGTSIPSDNCANCTAEQLADHDIKVWAYRLEEAVPGAQVVIKSEGQVTIDSEAQNRLWCIGIFWKDSGGKDIADGGQQVCGASNPDTNNPWAYYDVKVLL